SDFVFQTEALLVGKRRGDWRAYALHGATHYLSACAVVGLVDPHRLATAAFQVTLVCLSLLHLGIDWAKLALLSRNAGGTLAFALDQALHLATVAGAALLVIPPPATVLAAGLLRLRAHQEQILLATVVYVGVIFGGGHFIRMLIRPLWIAEPGQNRKEHDE